MELLKQFYSDLKLLLSSRTVQVLLATIVVNILNALVQFLDPVWMAIVTTIANTIAIYFRINIKAKL